MTNRTIDVYTLIKPEIIKLRKSNIETANLDCRLLLSKSMNRNKTLYNHETIDISENEIKTFQDLVQERLSGKPVSRIINKRNFWKNEFKLNEQCLDPRPDSETLIDAILGEYLNKSKNLKILDLGSGTGCLGLSLLDEYKNSLASFVDISKKSLEIVKINALKLGLSKRSKFINLDWKDVDWDIKLMKIEDRIKFDIIISNPPYISTEDIKNLQKEVKNYDPYIALNGGKDGLDAFKCIIPKLKNILKKDGKVFFEIGKGQEYFVSKKAIEEGFHPTAYKKDLSGVIRVIVFIFK